MKTVNVQGVDLIIDIKGGEVRITDKIGVWKAEFFTEEMQQEDSGLPTTIEVKDAVIQEIAMDIKIEEPCISFRNWVTRTMKELMLVEYPYDINRVGVARALQLLINN